MCTRAFWVFASVGLLCPALSMAGETICPCTADASVASSGSEAEQNSGTAPRIKIKGRENQLLMKFDLSAIPADAAIVGGTLWVKMAQPQFRFNQMAVSTVSTDWVEGNGHSIDGEGKAGEGVCHNYPRDNKSLWAQAGSTICDVTYGMGGSVEDYGFATPENDDWWKIPVSGRVLAAMRADSYGIAVMEETGIWAPQRANINVYSREQKKSAPYLVVHWSEGDTKVPSAPKALTLHTKDLDDGQVVLTFTAGGADGEKGTALGYEIRTVGEKVITTDNWDKAQVVRRWQTPRPAEAGKEVRAWITDLTPGASYSVGVVAYDSSGHRSRLAVGEMVTLPKKPAPRLSHMKAPAVRSGSPATFADIAVWATDELTKVDPVSGDVLDGDGYKNLEARKGSHVWDGTDHVVRLTATKGEIVGFNLVIEATEGSPGEIVIKPADLKGPSEARIPAGAFTLHRVWYVADKGKEKTTYYGDPVPVLNAPLQIPAKDNKVAGQTNQSVYVDLTIPHGIPAGSYRGHLAISTGAGSGRADVQVDVMDLEMPDTLSFIVELNAYGWPDSKNIDGWFAMHRLAHLHRMGYNVLSYGHCQSVTVPFLPVRKGEGAEAKTTDWKSFDRWMGPLLDGSAFADLPRNGVPIPHWYLPFHENYPGAIREHYAKPEFFKNEPLDADGNFDYVMWKDRVAAEDVDIRTAFDKTWHDEAAAIGGQYRDHFLDKGWTGTEFQIFCNNKHYFREGKVQNVNEKGTSAMATSLWTLDEPSYGRDFRALDYIYGVFKKSLVGAPLNVVTRGDVSRPEWQGDRCKGTLDLAVVSGALYSCQGLLEARRILDDERLWFYGGGNSPVGDNSSLAAVYIKTWTMGVDGGLAYWTSFAEQDGAWDRPQQLAVVLMQGGKGYKGPVATTRLKAQRRAEQDIELMNMLARQPGWDRTRVARAVAAAVNLTSSTVARGADDPGQTSFKNIHAADLAKIRLALVNEILASKESEKKKKE